MTEPSGADGRVHLTSFAVARAVEMAGGKGSGRALVTAVDGATGLEVHLNRVRAGYPPAPYHRHRVAEDVYVILRGTALVVLDGEPPRRLVAGDVLFIPPGVPHALGADGDSDVWLLEIYAPSARGDFERLESGSGPAAAVADAVQGMRLDDLLDQLEL